MGLFRNIGACGLVLLGSCNRSEEEIKKEYGIKGLNAEESLATYLTEIIDVGDSVDHCENIIIRDSTGEDLVSILRCSSEVMVRGRFDYLIAIKGTVEDYANSLSARTTYITSDGVVLDDSFSVN